MVTNTDDKIIYKAAVYMRLSKEDGDKVESDSISNQREFIKEFLKEKEGIEICSERIDDGYSGVNFDRPAFQKMMEEIREGSINCIVVKDLSRFGRNYIESGRYIERIFPLLKVRFIAINDNYDSAERNQSDCIIIPFKNLINDEYAKDISIKIRSHLDMKRRRGDFVGSFAAYGYFKSAEDKNKLIIDNFASKIVQDIFKWKLSGMSCHDISDKLNNLGILSPMEYKEELGMNYYTSFRQNIQAKWSAASVCRILKNEIYLGVLVQGREGTPNYKIRKKNRKPKPDWIRIENNHEPIISLTDFRTVNQLLETGSSTDKVKKEVYPFSGLLKCGDCSHNMVRKTVPYHNKNYTYYMCSRNKADHTFCNSHRINSGYLEEAVYYTITSQIKLLYNMDCSLQLAELQSELNTKRHHLMVLLLEKQKEINKYQELKAAIYKDYNSGFLSIVEYEEFSEIYSYKQKAASAARQEIIKEFIIFKEKYKRKITKSTDMQLDRNLMISLVDSIQIFENKRIQITLKYQDEFWFNIL